MLFNAIRLGNLERVKELIKAGVDINERRYGESALMVSINNGDLEIAKELIKNGADINIHGKCVAWSGATALMYASRYGDLEIVKELIKHGAEIDARDAFDTTALIAVSGSRNIYVNGRTINEHTAVCLEIIRELLRNGADINAKNYYGKTALLAAVSDTNIIHDAGIYEDIVEELLKNGADVNAKDNQGYTPLIQASRRGNINLVKEFLKLGADVNVRNWEGKTALMYATGTGNVEIVEELIRNGADIDIKDSLEDTALTAQFKWSWAKEGENQEIIKTLLKHGADIIYLIKRRGIDRFARIVEKQIQDKNYKELEKYLDAYYRYLNITHKDICDKNITNIFARLDEAKVLIDRLVKNGGICEQKREKHEFKKYIKALTYCKNETELDITIEKIPQNIVEMLMNGENNSKLQSDTDIFIIRNKLLTSLKIEVEKIEKVFEGLKNLENRVNLDYKQLIFSGINKLKANIVKGNEMELG